MLLKLRLDLGKCQNQKMYENKDHQRMRVDPMFMIIQSLRSFLTAVTTTAVAPIAVIFTCNLPEYT